MNKYSKLDVDTVVALANSAIGDLQDDNEALTNASDKFMNIVNNGSMTSNAIDSLRQVASDYTVAISGCMYANDLDIADYKTLIDSVGSKKLDGDTIITGMNDAKDNWDEAEKNYKYWLNELENLEWYKFFCYDSYSKLMIFYSAEATYYEREYNKWKAKADLYDSIEEQTSSLFTKSKDFRTEAEKGFKALSACYDGTDFVTTYDREWGENIEKYVEEALKDIKASWITDSGDYNWAEIEEFLEKDPEEVTQAEYKAFAELIAGMDLEDLQTLFNEDNAYLDQTKTQEMWNGEVTYSKVLEKSIQVYYSSMQVTAYTTFFNKDWDIDDERTVQILNDLSKANMLFAVSNKISENDGTLYSVNFEISDSTQSGYVNYIGKLSEVYTEGAIEGALSDSSQGDYNQSNGLAGQELYEINHLDEYEITSYNYMLGEWNSLDQAEKDSLSAIDSNYEWSEDCLQPYLVDLAGAKMLSGAATLLDDCTPLNVASDLFCLGTSTYREIENNITVTNALQGFSNASEIGAVVNACAINANIVSISGTKNSSYIANASINYDKLENRVDYYNKKHPDQDAITVETIISELGAGGGDNLDAYMEWYNSEGENYIEETEKRN